MTADKILTTAYRSCRHCGQPLALLAEFGLWYHEGRPSRGATWCSTSPDLDNLAAETTAAPAGPLPRPFSSRARPR